MFVARAEFNAPDVYFSHGVNALAGISCHFGMDEASPIPDEQLIVTLERLSENSNLRHNTRVCAEYVFARRPDLRERFADFNAVPTDGENPYGYLEIDVLRTTTDSGLRLRLVLVDSASDQTIHTISMSRDLADDLRASPPDGFVEEPMATQAPDLKDWDQGNIRWVGRYTVRPNEEFILVIPAESPTSGSGTIIFQYGSAARSVQI